VNKKVLVFLFGISLFGGLACAAFVLFSMSPDAQRQLEGFGGDAEMVADGTNAIGFPKLSFFKVRFRGQLCEGAEFKNEDFSRLKGLLSSSRYLTELEVDDLWMRKWPNVSAEAEVPLMKIALLTLILDQSFHPQFFDFFEPTESLVFRSAKGKKVGLDCSKFEISANLSYLIFDRLKLQNLSKLLQERSVSSLQLEECQFLDSQPIDLGSVTHLGFTGASKPSLFQIKGSEKVTGLILSSSHPQDFQAIGNFVGLEDLEIVCKKIESFQFLKKLPNLTKMNVNSEETLVLGKEFVDLVRGRKEKLIMTLSWTKLQASDEVKKQLENLPNFQLLQN